MSVMDIIRQRKSVRKFRPDPLPGETIEKLLEAARWAPTAGNIQPWYFYVVTSDDDRKFLAGAALKQDFLALAPAIIIVCAEPDLCARIYGERGRDLYCLQDTAAATQNILLVATEMGLGTCWVGAFEEDKIKGYMNMPGARRPVTLIAVGYPHKAGSRPGRKDLAEVTRVI